MSLVLGATVSLVPFQDTLFLYKDYWKNGISILSEYFFFLLV